MCSCRRRIAVVHPHVDCPQDTVQLTGDILGSMHWALKRPNDLAMVLAYLNWQPWQVMAREIFPCEIPKPLRLAQLFLHRCIKHPHQSRSEPIVGPMAIKSQSLDDFGARSHQTAHHLQHLLRMEWMRAG